MAELILNPSAATDLTAWSTDSDASLTRVTSVPGTTIPSPASTAFRIVDGGSFECDAMSFPGNVTEGSEIRWSLDLSPGETAAGGTFDVAIDWYSGASEVSYTDIVVASTIVDGWTHYEGTATIPSGCDGFDVYATSNGGGSTYIYMTNVSAEAISAMLADGDIAVSGAADLSLFTEMAADGIIALSGSAWLSPREHGQDTLAASGTIQLRGRATRLSAYTVVAVDTSSEASPTVITTTAPHLLGPVGTTVLVTIAGHTSTPDINGDWTATITGASTFTIPVEVTSAGSGGTSSTPDPYSGAALPATDEDGWTLPDVTEPDIMGLTVALSGVPFAPAQIEDLTIELDVEGGPKSATISLNVPMDRRPTLGTDTLLVTYKTQVLFRGRLEQIVGDVSSTTGYTLTYAGPLVELRDHKAYRTVYVDSDLDSWRVDQGPQTSPDTFEGIAAGVW